MMTAMKKNPDREGFRTDLYLKYQAEAIMKIVRAAHTRLYIEFGGKIVNDKHAARVLPGYREDTKAELIKNLISEAEIIFVVSGRDILRGRMRGDFKITYDQETIRAITELRSRGLPVQHVAISLLEWEKEIPKKITEFQKTLAQHKLISHPFFAVKYYPSARLNMDSLKINPFVNVSKRIVLILSPGGGSGKFGVCLNQLYHEMKNGIQPQYLKFETFPVHNLPVRHPINLAYMAASADFYDVVMKDPNREKATSYKRDVENYALLHKLASDFPKEGRYLRKLTSATQMGINMLSSGIINDELVQKESAAEIARRLIRYKFEVTAGEEDRHVLARVRTILKML